MDLLKKLTETLENGDDTQTTDVAKEVFARLGFCNYQTVSKSKALLIGTATDSVTQETLLLALWRIPAKSVSADAIKFFCDTVKTANVSGGIFLSAGKLSSRKAAGNGCAKPITFMGEKELTRRLASFSFFAPTESLFSNDTKEAAEESPISPQIQPAPPAKPLTPLRHSKLMRVTFPDGTVFCDKSTSQTFIQAIQHIGIERVAGVGLVVAHCPLITREVPSSLAEWSKPIGNGWNIILQSDTDQRHRQLLAINNSLGIGMKIEVGSNFSPISVTRAEQKTNKAKSRLEIRLSDGFVINNPHATDTYVSFMKYVGIDKLARLNLKLSGKSLITSTKQYNDQVQLAPNRWLTIPTSNKLKYRAIKVVASMAHIAAEVQMA